MPKFVRLDEAALELDTTINSIYVTACAHKKQNGEYPKWYSSTGERGASKSYVDVEYLTQARDKEYMYRRVSSSDYYWYLIDEMRFNQSVLARYIASKATKYKNWQSWRGFMQRALFAEPVLKFTNTVSMANEFYHVVKPLVDQHRKGVLDERCIKAREKMASA